MVPDDDTIINAEWVCGETIECPVPDGERVPKHLQQETMCAMRVNRKKTLIFLKRERYNE